jgi:hypothetical protein
MIHFTLSKRIDLARPDPQGRTYYGWWHGMSEEECYQVNRHRWVLGPGLTANATPCSAPGTAREPSNSSAWPSGSIISSLKIATDSSIVGPRAASRASAPITGVRAPVRYFASPFD